MCAAGGLFAPPPPNPLSLCVLCSPPHTLSVPPRLTYMTHRSPRPPHSFSLARFWPPSFSPPPAPSLGRGERAGLCRRRRGQRSRRKSAARAPSARRPIHHHRPLNRHPMLFSPFSPPTPSQHPYPDPQRACASEGEQLWAPQAQASLPFDKQGRHIVRVCAACGWWGLERRRRTRPKVHALTQKTAAIPCMHSHRV